MCFSEHIDTVLNWTWTDQANQTSFKGWLPEQNFHTGNGKGGTGFWWSTLGLSCLTSLTGSENTHVYWQHAALEHKRTEVNMTNIKSMWGAQSGKQKGEIIYFCTAYEANFVSLRFTLCKYFAIIISSSITKISCLIFFNFLKIRWVLLDSGVHHNN